MLKRLGSVLAVFVLCLLATTAYAEIKDFPKFKVDVPAGWSAELDDETVTFLANDKSASLTISIAGAEGKTAQALAEDFSKELGGGKPEAMEDGVYTFSFKAGEVGSNAFITLADNGKDFVLFVITGEHPAIEKIIDSLEPK